MINISTDTALTDPDDARCARLWSEPWAARGWGERGTGVVSFASQLKFENISFSYSANQVLSEINLVIDPGQIVCLLGLSGSGKTTLLRLAAGLEKPLSGRILIDERQVSVPGFVEPPEQRGIGFMFQDYALFPHMTIINNVRFGLRSLKPKIAVHEAMLLLARVGLADRAGDYPHNLSGGEQQRVALARALVSRPGIMLMDEPFSGLDRILREKVRAETLAVLREANATTLVVTHDPEEAMFLADRIVLLDKGRIIQSGTPDDLYNHPETVLVARFFSTLNEFSAVVADGKVATPVGQIVGNGLANGTRVMVVVRPEAITISASDDDICGCLDHDCPALGRIVEKRYLGGGNYFELVVKNFSHNLTVKSSVNDDIGVGDQVFVGLKQNGWFVFLENGHRY